ncbi:IclR family transcriptional regulator [Halomarina litorea]|uniref:IclR family transcriptional regulator n=1 Tax=Halomarina litorea TaxID=2961595 RepID=UPI0020C3C970|nr:IclR family transcriptional regulator [Halomarina sp. BCD28]
MGQNHRIKTTETVFEIIETLVRLEVANLSEVAAAVEKPRSTVFDHLATLRELGYVVKDQSNYRPSLQFLELGGCIRFDRDIYHVARPELRKLTEETGEPATLGVEENDYAVFLYSVEGEYTTRSTEFDGSHTWLHANALGKVLLAFQPESRVERLVNQYGLSASTENTITDPSELYSELESVRENGYATDIEEGKLGLNGVAMPVFCSDKEPVAAVSVYTGTSLTDIDDFVDRVIEPLQRTTSVIEVNHSFET